MEVFFVKAINLNYQNVTLFKNQKNGTLSGVEQIFETANDSEIKNGKNPIISAIHSKDTDLLKEGLLCYIYSAISWANHCTSFETFHDTNFR